MACILQLECNFFHKFFKCWLPVEMVDFEVKITPMQGIHTFRRDRTCQIIRCNPWSTRLYPYPSLIRKVRMYLELEGNLGTKLGQQPQPQQKQTQPGTVQPSTNPLVRRGMKKNDKRRKLIPTRGYKVQVVTKPIPAPAPKVTNMIMQTSMTIPSTLMNLAKEKENPPQETSSANDNPPPVEDIPTRAGTPWPKTGQYQRICLSPERTGLFPLPLHLHLSPQ